MRITGGRARGIPLKCPPGEGTRPATDRMREAVFSSLGPSIEGVTVADLFAGTGAYGLEALSRGAASGCFIESAREALACLRQNLRAVLRSCEGEPEVWQVIARDAFATPRAHRPFELVFADPPYTLLNADPPAVFERAIAPLAAPGARVVLELPGDVTPEIPGWHMVRRIGKAGRDKPTATIWERKPLT